MTAAPPPLPPREKVARTALVSVVLALIAWLGMISLVALGMLDGPAKDDRTAILVSIAAFLIIATTAASLVLAVRVLWQRRRGLVFALIALLFSAPPALFIAVGLTRAALK